ncbi:MAG: hypothetical protein LQ341_001282 [Variospora aurantia]|nr:MAG: hypothetical protein LQ341_001282 [Variospora aurantia]
MGPTSDALAHFAAISCLPDNIAADWLKLFDNDVEKTINAFLDDAHTLDKKKRENAWNENQFHTDRGDNGGQQNAFTVHHQDSLKPNVFENVAPSRPPSRNTVNLNDGYISAGGINRSMTLAEQEDADFQKAVDLSKSQLSPAQDSGTTAADKPYFGPVRHEYHDTKSWVMTTSKSTAKEIILNPEPKDRRRPTDTPAFFRPSPAGHRLPGVMKILHAIPAAREALLGRNRVSTDYGYHNEWWDGAPIEAPIIVQAEEAHTISDTDVICESQRLMAFLDATERAYGSTEALSTFPGLREYGGDSILKSFLNTWSNNAAYYDSAAGLCDLFKSTGTKMIQGDKQSEDIVMLELELNEVSSEVGQTLYDVMDALLWPGWDGIEHDRQIFLENVANVLVIRITQVENVAKGLEVKIPPVWYSDRYRESAQPRIQEMLAAKTSLKREIDDLESRKQKTAEFSPFNQQGKPIAVNRLLEVARQHFEKTVAYGNAKQTQVEAMDQEVPDLKAYGKIAEELKLLSDRVAGKLQMFEESKEAARGKLRELSKLFTESSDNPDDCPQDRYTLRGVCAAPHIVYVQERIKSDSEDDLLDLGPGEDWQWWKLSYEANAAQPVSCTKVREIEVLKAARDEAPSAILVYASDRAMAVENRALPPSLQRFVHNDNRAFAAELAVSRSTPPQLATKNPYLHPVPEGSAFRPAPTGQSRTEEDLDLPSYSDHTFPVPPRDRSYDDFIPVSLRQDGVDVDESLEMTEREGAAAFTGGGQMGGGGGGGGGEDGYRLGSYDPPEMRMEDGEDEETQRKR